MIRNIIIIVYNANAHVLHYVDGILIYAIIVNNSEIYTLKA